MKLSKRITAGLSGTVLAASALMIVGASPASAATPSGGCWVYTPTTPANIEDTTPASSTSTSLAPWADASGPAARLRAVVQRFHRGRRDTQLQPGLQHRAEERRPASERNGLLLLLGQRCEPAGDQQGVQRTRRRGHPRGHHHRLVQDHLRGANNLKLRKVIYDIPSFFTRVDCNGQSAGVGGGTNPATTPDRHQHHLDLQRHRTDRNDRLGQQPGRHHACSPRRRDRVLREQLRGRHRYGVAVRQLWRQLRCNHVVGDHRRWQRERHALDHGCHHWRPRRSRS